MLTARDFLYGEKSPWPAPSKFKPEGMPAMVPDLPRNEVQEFFGTIVERYNHNVTHDWPGAARHCLLSPHLQPVSDHELVHQLSETCFSYALNPTLDPADAESFSAVLEQAQDDDRFYKVDFSAMEDFESYPGIYTAATVTLLRRRGGQLEAVAIRINGLVLTPEDTHAWQLAKYFVLQAATTLMTLCQHPRLHFPMDSVNAVTKTALPKNHVIFRLLEPHLRFSLPLNRSTLYHPKSIVSHNEKEIYTPYAGPTDSLRELISIGYRGIAGNSSYPEYRFPMRPETIHSDYGTFVKVYYDVIYRFVEKVLQGRVENDPLVRDWAGYISEWVPGFPDGEAIFAGDNLVAAITFFIWDVSVMHSSDHNEFAGYPINQAPLRIRVPPPTAKRIPPLNLRKLTRRFDVFKYWMAKRMFFAPTNISLLQDTEYNFEESALRQTARDFLQELRDADANMPVRRFVPLSEISRSIQY
ncbi:MAG: hypothetical protein AAF657_25320 [Acidobacteriota bacterium]